MNINSNFDLVIISSAGKNILSVSLQTTTTKRTYEMKMLLSRSRTYYKLSIWHNSHTNAWKRKSFLRFDMKKIQLKINILSPPAEWKKVFQSHASNYPIQAHHMLNTWRVYPRTIQWKLIKLLKLFWKRVNIYWITIVKSVCMTNNWNILAEF